MQTFRYRHKRSRTICRGPANAEMSTKQKRLSQNCFDFRRFRAIRSARTIRIDRTIGPTGRHQTMNWYYVKDNAQAGPVDHAALDGLFRDGTIQRRHPRVEPRNGNLAAIFRGPARATARTYRQRGCLRGMRQNV